jgi:predicted transglutaminase-like cysteine proteinase
LAGDGRGSAEMTPAVNLLQISDDNAELLESLEKHLAMVEEQLESVIRKASSLPVEQQDEYWALASDFQKEIRLTRKEIELQRNRRTPPRN